MTDERNKKKYSAKQNRKAKNKKRRAGVLLATIFLLAYIPSLINWIYGSNVRTDYIRHGEIEVFENTVGLIIRNSHVYEAPFTGVFIPEVQEGEKVANKANIAAVMKDTALDYVKELREKEEQMVQAKREKNENASVFSHDVMKLEEDIGTKVQDLMNLMTYNSFYGMEKIKKRIDEIVLKKASIIGEEGSTDTYIKSLIKEANDIRSKIEKSRTNIKAEESGIISYSIDGYEKILNMDSLKDITPDVFEDIEITALNAYYSSEKKTEAYQPFVKVATGIDFYIAVLVDKSSAGLFGYGDAIEMRVNDVQVELDAKMVYRSTQQNGKYLLAFKCNEFMSDTIHLRKVNVDLVKKKFEGSMVPLNSLIGFEKGNQTAMLAVDEGGFAALYDVEILGNNEHYAIIANNNENVGLYDTFIVNPKNIVHGQRIR